MNIINELHHSIKYVVIWSEMGKNIKNIRNKENLIRGKRQGSIRRYYDPNENSTKQAHNFIETVKLYVGDMSSILDI